MCRDIDLVNKVVPTVAQINVDIWRTGNQEGPEMFWAAMAHLVHLPQEDTEVLAKFFRPLRAAYNTSYSEKVCLLFY